MVAYAKPNTLKSSSKPRNTSPPEMFLNIIGMVAKNARRSLRQVMFLTQSADHPILCNVPSTQYLKFLIVQVL
jgi:23S rRNA (cytosine1962-C5)-methyltransferase